MHENCLKIWYSAMQKEKRMPRVEKTIYFKRIKNKGIGLFAARDFSKGDSILVSRGRVFRYDEIEDGSYRDVHCIQIGKKKYLGPSGLMDDFVNHSCAPNAGLIPKNRKLLLIAITRIRTGEEVTWNYSTYLDESHWTMRCDCGSNNCRKIIKDFKLLPHSRQEYYLKLGIVAKFIAKQYCRAQ